MKKWIIIVVVVGLFGWAAYDFLGKDGEEEFEAEVGLEKGNIAPDFELETLDGEAVKLSDYRGEKVLLNFWATWCPPCRAEMPDMQKVHEENRDDGVILAVNVRETEQSDTNVKNFIDEYGISFEVLSDADTVVSNIYNAHQLPTSYFIDSEGRIDNLAIGAVNYELIVQKFEEMD